MLTKFVTSKIFLAVVRHFVGLLAGVALSKGYIDASMVETIIGSVMGLAAVGWSAIEKEQAQDRETVALHTTPPMRTG